MGAHSMVVHTRARQLLEWLMPQLARFPREHRHTLTQHMSGLALRAHDALVAARHLTPPGRSDALLDDDIALDQLRQYLLLAWEWKWFNKGQYEHACRLCEELGRLLGGWRRGSARGHGGR